MPQHASNTPVCRDCDGFPVVAITTGECHRDGTRVTLHVACPACQGTGYTVRAAVLARIGR